MSRDEIFDIKTNSRIYKRDVYKYVYKENEMEEENVFVSCNLRR